MSRLNTIPFRTARSAVPSGPAGASFRTPRSSSGGSKKGYAGSVAGLRGNRPSTGASTPKGPTRVFPSVNLARVRSTAAAPPARRSLLNRVVGRARSAFGT